MAERVMYVYQGDIVTTYFSHPKAILPVLLNTGEIKLIPWGRHKTQSGELPFGGWARLSTIKKGQWDAYFRKPVKIPILKFLEKDFEGSSHWFDITKGKWIQGLLVQEGNELRIYIVTITPELSTMQFNRWPRIMSG